MSVADNSIVRAAVKFALGPASDIMNIYHFVMDSVGDVSNSNALADVKALVENLMANVSAQVSGDVDLSEVELWVRNTTLDRWDYVGAIDSTWSGGAGTGDALPVASAALITADTTDSHSRGKKYLPPFSETALSGSLLTSAALTALANFLADYVSVYTGTYAEWAPGVWSEKDNNFKLFTGTGKTTNVPGYQRRRKPGVGA